MADTKQNNKTRPYRIPLDRSPKASQEVFVSVNFKNYVIKRGVTVDLPEEVIEVLEKAEEAENVAMYYSDEQMAKQNKPIE